MPKTDQIPPPLDAHQLKTAAPPALPPLAEAYAGPAARFLVSAVAGLLVTAGLVEPIAGGALTAMDAGLASLISRLSQRRVQVFLEELQRHPVQLTEKAMQSDEFVDALRETVAAVAKERREEKVRIFARLFAHSAEHGRLGDDRYQEFRQILEDVTYREMQVLLLLHRFETTTPLRTPQGFNDQGLNFVFLRAGVFWPGFSSSLQQDLDIPSGEMEGVLTRLARTGLYKGFDGMIMGDEGGMGHLTPYFDLFVEWIGGN